jgi:hypothetical protein
VRAEVHRAAATASSGYRPGSWGTATVPLREPPPDDPAAAPRVRLGFADGSSVNLDSDSREAAAIRAAAARLIDEPR